MEIKVVRTFFSGDSTIGLLYINDKLECFTLEDMVREVAGIPVSTWKIDGKTAIPYGKYDVIMDMSSRFHKVMPHILNVPGFNGIRIHAGNYASDTEGCILVGKKKYNDSVGESRIAYEELTDKIRWALDDDDKVEITITNPMG